MGIYSCWVFLHLLKEPSEDDQWFNIYPELSAHLEKLEEPSEFSEVEAENANVYRGQEEWSGLDVRQ